MSLTKRTTILLPPKLHEQLARLAAQRETSLGSLVRLACVRQYGFAGSSQRLRAVRELTSFDLPGDELP